MTFLKYYKRKLLYLFSLFVIITLGSCKKFVQVPVPSTQIVTASVFSNDGAAHSALVSIYGQMCLANGISGESGNMVTNNGLLADELINLSLSSIISFYQNALSSINSYGPWTNAYQYIYQSNAVMEGLQNNEGVTPAVKTQLTGEAKFIRAFWYFYLVNCYGDVPLATTTDYRINDHLVRSPKALVYEQVISDLKTSLDLLNSNYVNQYDTSTTSNRVRPVKAAAEALLARAYLYTNKFDSAEMYASSVINDGKFSLVPDLNSVFLADSPEAIWQLRWPAPNSANIQTSDGNLFVLLGAPQQFQSYLNPLLFNSFEPGDQRKLKWINSYTDGVTTWYYPFKYQVYDNNNNPTNRQENVMMLRLAEQYLIRAEARVQKSSPDITGALADINSIRHRAGLGDYAGATDKASLLAEVFHQRQDELFCEWGHRWFDMIRMGYVNSIMGAPGNVCQQKGGTWDDYKTLYPIPMTEIQNNPNLSQNPGY